MPGAAAGLVVEPLASAGHPRFGKRSAAFAVRANFFALKYPKDVALYDYPVVIAPDVVSAAVRKHARYLHEIVHDWTQKLASRSRLPADFSVTVSEGPERVYTVKVLEPKELRSADMDRYLQGEDVNYNPLPIISAFNLITTAHALHTGVPDKKAYLFPPAVLGESPLALSAGFEAWKGFFASVRPAYKKLINVCMGAFYVPNAHCTGKAIPRAFYRHVRVTTKHLGYHRKSGIKAFGSQSARKTVFQCDELGGMVSVEQYFQRNFNIRFQHADDFSVINVGNKMKDIFVPAELLSWTCSLGARLSVAMAVGPARLLSPPKVIYSSGPLTVANGYWNTRDVRLHLPAPLTGAAILVLADNGREDFRDSSDPALRGVVTRFLATCLAGGMQIDDALPPLLFTFPACPNIMLVFASISEIYLGLKKLCDSKLGIATRCQDRYFSSIVLKINTKLGGVDHQLDASFMRWLKNTMLVGMDLTPGVGCVEGMPSILQVLAFKSTEKSGVKQMMIEDLNEYSKHMKTLPERVVVFRGGTRPHSPEIKAAFRSFKGYSHKLIIAICGKQHRTRFYPTRPKQAGKTSNTKAGTLIDRGVTAVYNFDFFLQAHVGQQGTNRLRADDIQQGTHDASYLGRLVPPAYERASILPPPPDSRESAMDEAQILLGAKELWGVHENLRGSMSYL
ncbi:Piwi-domain-containing protein [Phellopilus nigrolimitatus]|nr:Piwi-domain-containing protein [Phellopilus nigrolimitatus]